MFDAISSFCDHMGPMGKRDANHSIDMVHINTSYIVFWIGIIKQGNVSEFPFLEACLPIRFRIVVFFHHLTFSCCTKIEQRQAPIESRVSSVLCYVFQVSLWINI
jgi:hypothetical protein